jgi:hypothetical protein
LHHTKYFAPVPHTLSISHPFHLWFVNRWENILWNEVKKAATYISDDFQAPRFKIRE